MNTTPRLYHWTLHLRIPIISIDLGLNIRKGALIGVFLMLVGFAIPFLAVLKIIDIGFFLAFLSFGLAWIGGILLLMFL